MKITFVLPTVSLSGGTRVVAKHCELLQQRSHRVTVVCVPKPPDPMRTRLRRLLRTGRWKPVDSAAASHIDGLELDVRVVANRPPHREDIPDADVVIATWWETAEWVAACDEAKGVKVYFVQDHEVFGFLPVERARATYRSPLHKIVVSRWLSDIMANEYDDPDHDLVPNAVDLGQFHADARGKQARPTFGFVYTPAPRKSVKTCIAAIELARQAIPGLKVVSFGARPPGDSLPLPDWVEFHLRPEQSQISSIYAKCDAWLFTSESEGFGLPLLESMACRTPVIATPAGAAPELLASGGGLTVPAGDPRAVAEAMGQVHAMTDADWRAMSQRAHRQATSHSWDRAADAFESALENAIERSTGRKPSPASP